MPIPNNPITRKESYLAAIAGQEVAVPEYPITREEAYLEAIMNNGGGASGSVRDFIDNIDVDYEFDETTDANYTVIRIYKKKIDGTPQYPFVYAPSGISGWNESALDVATRCGWLMTINSGLGKNGEVDGQLVENSVILQNHAPIYHAGSRPLVIDSNGNLSETATNADAVALVQNGAVSVVCGFMAIIKDYEPVPSSEWPNISHFTQNVQRQIIGQFGNGDYCIVTCEGRNYDHSDGWTIEEAQDICQKIGLKFAYNLDGGGSTETVLGKKQINTIYEGQTGRKVPTFLIFNGGTTFTRPEPIPKKLYKISASKTTTSYTVGDTLSTSDITTTAYYSDGTSATVQGTYNTSAVDMSTAGTYNITVSYTESNVTKTTTIAITVAALPQISLYSVRGKACSYNSQLGRVFINGTNAARGYAVSNESGYEIKDWNGNSLNPKQYAISIPTTATSITCVLTGATALRPAFSLWNADCTEELKVEGWASSNTKTASITAGQYSYLTVQIKNSASNEITEEQWITPELWTLEFD